MAGGNIEVVLGWMHSHHHIATLTRDAVIIENRIVCMKPAAGQAGSVCPCLPGALVPVRHEIPWAGWDAFTLLWALLAQASVMSHVSLSPAQVHIPGFNDPKAGSSASVG